MLIGMAKQMWAYYICRRYIYSIFKGDFATETHTRKYAQTHYVDLDLVHKKKASPHNVFKQVYVPAMSVTQTHSKVNTHVMRACIQKEGESRQCECVDRFMSPQYELKKHTIQHTDMHRVIRKPCMLSPKG